MYSEPYTYSQKKEVKDDVEISIEDVKLVAEAVLGIKLQVENIHV